MCIVNFDLHTKALLILPCVNCTATIQPGFHLPMNLRLIQDASL